MKKYIQIIGYSLLVIAAGSITWQVMAAVPIIDTIVGNGTAGFLGDNGLAKEAKLDTPTGVALDGAGNLYIADRFNNRIRQVITATGIISTVVGSGLTGPGNGGFGGDNGVATEAQLNLPSSIVVDLSGNLYIADTLNNRVRQVTTGTQVITTVAGDGSEAFAGDNGLAINAQLQGPTGIATDGQGDLYIADANNNRIRKVVMATGVITTVAGSGPTGHANGDFSGDGGLATEAALNYPSNVTVDKAGNLYIADSYNHRIRQVLDATGVITTVAGSGLSGPGNGGYSGDGGAATEARLNFPTGVAVDKLGNLYIADNGNQRIRKVMVATGVITTVAGTGVAGYGGDGEVAIEAQLSLPTAITLDSWGNLYIADQDNHRIRRIEGLGVWEELYLPIIVKNKMN
ncbi:MAG: hypothetical protein KDJ52_23600 [Anaerolineae bacterium]|nr:hypothetical protein [Anaerolineae bacterium]MCB0212347.1 hypothetical protein [Anaerolineae bacterium]